MPPSRDKQSLHVGKSQSALESTSMIRRAEDLARLCCVTDGQEFRLKEFEPGSKFGFHSEDHPLAKQALESGVAELARLQDMFYAQDRWAMLLIFQGIDAAGKDGAIKHVMSGINPQGCQVYSFKQPSTEELNHDYLWRCMKRLPGRGEISIFNRSYYEEVLAVRVHPELLANQRLPSSLVTDKVWGQRYEDIRNLERYLSRNGTCVVKFFLNLSRDEQRQRFLDRLNDPAKNWKFDASDIIERESWDSYQKSFDDMICHTATPENPWFVIPADHKWITRIMVSAIVIDRLTSLKLSYPRAKGLELDAIQRAKEELRKESHEK